MTSLLVAVAASVSPVCAALPFWGGNSPATNRVAASSSCLAVNEIIAREYTSSDMKFERFSSVKIGMAFIVR